MGLEVGRFPNCIDEEQHTLWQNGLLDGTCNTPLAYEGLEELKSCVVGGLVAIYNVGVVVVGSWSQLSQLASL